MEPVKPEDAAEGFMFAGRYVSPGLRVSLESDPLYFAYKQLQAMPDDCSPAQVREAVLGLVETLILERHPHM